MSYSNFFSFKRKADPIDYYFITAVFGLLLPYLILYFLFCRLFLVISFVSCLLVYELYFLSFYFLQGFKNYMSDF